MRCANGGAVVRFHTGHGKAVVSRQIEIHGARKARHLAQKLRAARMLERRYGAALQEGADGTIRLGARRGGLGIGRFGSPGLRKRVRGPPVDKFAPNTEQRIRMYRLDQVMVESRIPCPLLVRGLAPAG